MIPDLLKTVKKQLHALCKEFVDQRIATAQDAIKAAQQSANEDSKSSMGDKYETGRAMAQLEIEKNTIQLYEAMKVKRNLEQISPERSTSTKIQNGSLVITDNGNYYLSISAGKYMVEGESYFTVSISSPIGHQLLSLEVGDVLEFNGKKISVMLVV